MRHELGIDLYEYIRGERPWAQFYRFLARLPRYGHFYASVLSDEESVEDVVRTSDDKKSSIPLVGWTTDHDLLSTIVDVLNNVHATLIQVNTENGKRPDVMPMRRPATALERIEARQAVEEHRTRVRMLRPK